MIFFLLIVIGIHFAVSVQQILPFYLCILLRSAYLQRPLKILYPLPVLVALLFFLINWYDNYYNLHNELNRSSWSTYPALIYSLKIVVGSAALIHSIRGLLEFRATQVFSLGFYVYYSVRAMSLLSTRFKDFLYAYREIRASATSLLTELRLLLFFVISLFLETILLYKSMEMMIEARGGIPNNDDWQRSINTTRYLGCLSYKVIGDVVLVIFIGACLIWWSNIKTVLEEML